MATVAPAQAGTSGTRSLAKVLAKDGSGFDHNWHDYDVIDNAVQAVLKANPGSPVGVLADGKAKLTAFLPTDRAFQLLVKDLTGNEPTTEKATFTAVASLGIPTVEKVLLYHVVVGTRINYKQALKSDGARLTMASGGIVRVDVRKSPKRIKLLDADRNDANPRIVEKNINKGNEQIAHGINRVLRPLDL
ncbi:MAG TPA: fasciclin domain-containing protein [Microlunatus sp.]